MNIAIVGATGLAGIELDILLNGRRMEVDSLQLFASDASAGQNTVSELFGRLMIQANHPDMFRGIDIAFLATSPEISRQIVPWAVAHGTYVIDKSSAFRLDPKVPLIIPEVNYHEIRKDTHLFACPNCTTTILMTALWPLHQQFGLTRLRVATSQSISGAGKKALDRFGQDLTAHLSKPASWYLDDGIDETLDVNPAIDVIGTDGYSGEERKMIDESRKLLGIPSFPISATCTRVPVRRGHSMSVFAEFRRPISVKSATDVLSYAKGVSVSDALSAGDGITANSANEQEYCIVSRIRKDTAVQNGLALWIAGDNLWKGAALNAIQIAEHLVTIGI